MDERKRKVARNALQKYLNNNYSEDQQEEIAFFTDIEDEDSYTWRMNVEGKLINLKYHYQTKKVEVE